MPADGPERRLHGPRDPAFRLETHHHSRNEVSPTNRFELGERQHRGDNGRGWMDGGQQVRVVEVEHMRADAVDRGSVEYIKALRATENTGLRWPREWRNRRKGDLDRLVP